MNRINLFLRSLEKAFATAGEIAPWPVHVSIPSIYCGDFEASDLFSKLKKISKEDQPSKILSKLMVGPSVAKALLMDLICGLKVAKPSISVDERVWFVENYFDGVENLQAGDIFCLDDTNQILTLSGAQNLFEKTPWIWLESSRTLQDLARSLYKASAATKSLIWSLYFYGWDDIGYEIHGPYEVTDKSGKKLRLVITDYFDLKPTLLWNSMESFPYHSIKLRALYDKNVDLSVDMFCHFVNKGNLLNTTSGIYLEVNGIPIRTKEAADGFIKVVLDKVSKQHDAIEGMTKEQVIKKYIESRYYAFRRWRMYFHEDWRPPKEVLQRIKNWGIIEIPEGEGPDWGDLKKAFDPRTDFVPGEPPK